MADSNDKTPALAEATEVSKAFSRTRGKHSTSRSFKYRKSNVSVQLLAKPSLLHCESLACVNTHLISSPHMDAKNDHQFKGGCDG